MHKTIHSKYGKAIAKALTQMRSEAGLTQRELAQKLNREHSFIAYCELGERRVDIAEFYWFCKACEADPQSELCKLISEFED